MLDNLLFWKYIAFFFLDEGYVKMYLKGRPITMYMPKELVDTYCLEAKADLPPKKLKLDWVYPFVSLLLVMWTYMQQMVINLLVITCILSVTVLLSSWVHSIWLTSIILYNGMLQIHELLCMFSPSLQLSPSNIPSRTWIVFVKLPKVWMSVWTVVNWLPISGCVPT